MLHALIMSGGNGTRFWPRSREARPKQFLKLAGERTLLQQTFDRIEALSTAERTWIITGLSHWQGVAEQLPEVPHERIIAEPSRRDTAACIGVGAALIAAEDPDAVTVVIPADHVIEPEQEFRRAAQAAVRLAEEHPSALITFGIPATYPATGYGYIRRGKPLPGRLGVNVFEIQTFHEKPDLATAEKYVFSGEYLWNSGIFVWRAATLLTVLAERQPQLHAAVDRIAKAWRTGQCEEVFRREYEPLKGLSIDYAVMEGCCDGLVVQAPFQWDDVGSWGAIERLHPQDAAGNTVLGTHYGLDTRSCLIAGEPRRLIATAGVENLIIVQDGDATLIADKRDETAIKKLVEHLRAAGLEQYL